MVYDQNLGAVVKKLEDAEQICVMQYAARARIPGTTHKIKEYLLHIPNEGQRHVAVGQKLKRLGLKRGVSDLFLAWPVASMNGCWIEMKKCRKDYRTEGEAERAVTPEQANWIIQMNEAGYYARVAYGAGEAIIILRTYLGIEG